MPRSYEDGCAAAHALDLIGERWALLVVRELLLGPKRFTDLRAGLPGISPNVLSQRLDELERVGVVRRRRLLPPAASWVYDLTPWGQELEPIILQLGRWGARSPLRCPSALSPFATRGSNIVRRERMIESTPSSASRDLEGERAPQRPSPMMTGSSSMPQSVSS